jgi:TrmH family RNA methyltransferase
MTVETVSSAANDTIKLLRSLDRKKARLETGLFLAEGARLAEEGLRHAWRPAYALAGHAAFDRAPTRRLMERLHGAGARILSVSDRVLEAVSRKDNPQTVLCAFRMRDQTLESLATDGRRRWMALYEVRDPGNLGSILRTADASGVSAVLLVGVCCDPFSVEAVRASMGSLFAMPFVRCAADDLDRWRRRIGASLVAASMRGAQRPEEAPYGERCVILMGNEQSGIPGPLEASCDVLVRIPMRGTADSLNLAAASGLMMYEAWRAHGYEGAQ